MNYKFRGFVNSETGFSRYIIPGTRKRLNVCTLYRACNFKRLLACLPVGSFRLHRASISTAASCKSG